MHVVTVYVQPGASQTRLVGLHDGMPKIALQAKPIEGEANKALLAFLSKLLCTPKSTLGISSGHNSRIKRVEMPKECAAQLTALAAASRDPFRVHA
ncbi:MAG: hypothetical protein RL320_1699 [Pseudomonadota bacterium]